MRSFQVFQIADNATPQSLSSSMRRARFARFLQLLNVTSLDSILDVGGSDDPWLGTGLEKNVTILNLFSPSHASKLRFVEGDGCNMQMFCDQEFDVIFSNSVIEHVGRWERQIQFASEIRRVAKRYWVQTPYVHFPLEPHFLFPFFQYFPAQLQRAVGRCWKYSHLKRNNENIEAELSRLHLLSRRQFKVLFPESQILTEKVFGITKSLIAFRS